MNQESAGRARQTEKQIRRWNDEPAEAIAVFENDRTVTNPPPDYTIQPDPWHGQSGQTVQDGKRMESTATHKRSRRPSNASLLHFRSTREPEKHEAKMTTSASQIRKSEPTLVPARLNVEVGRSIRWVAFALIGPEQRGAFR
jgi:hypothetical protein